jgi:hypothetical protein
MSEPVWRADQAARRSVLEALNESYSVVDTLGPGGNGNHHPPRSQRDEPAQDSGEQHPVDLENFGIDMQVELSGPDFEVEARSPSTSMEDMGSAPAGDRVEDALPGLNRESRAREGAVGDDDGESSPLQNPASRDTGWEDIWSTSSIEQPSFPQYRHRPRPLFRLRRRLSNRRLSRLYPWWAGVDR